MTAKTSTFILGIIFLILGIVGFIPGLTMHHMHSDIAVTEGMGLELGLFPVNVLHNIVHIFFGVWGLLAARTFPASRFYGRATLVIYAILVVMGLIESAQINTAFGLVPLYNNDVWLHLLIALAGLYIGWIARARSEPDHPTAVNGACPSAPSRSIAASRARATSRPRPTG